MAIIRLQGKAEKEAGVYYEVDSAGTPIGEGGMGKVYQGKSVNTRTGVTRPVAIKFLFMDLPEQAIDRARREASIRLRNDNLIEMLGFIETDEDRDGKIIKHYHVVSELLNGVALSDIIQGKCTNPKGEEIPYAKELLELYKTNPDEFAKTIIKAALSGLMALHDAGYIHRDLDPSNIFITNEGNIKIIDFGICKQLKNLGEGDKQLTVAGAFMGKPEYAAPELALGDLQHQNLTTDIYAMGILLYQCLTGKVPFEGTRFDILDKQVKEKMPLTGIKNQNLKRIINKATEKRQELRYQTAAEMRVDLESLDVKRAADPRKRRKMIIGGVIAFLLVAGAVVFFLLYQSDVESKQVALQDKAYVDSLNNVININAHVSDSLVKVGAAHGEGYDEQLVKAKECYVRIAAATQLLKAKGADFADFSQKEGQLDAMLLQALDELTEKAEVLADDPDPSVVEEVESIYARIDRIKAFNIARPETPEAPAETAPEPDSDEDFEATVEEEGIF